MSLLALIMYSRILRVVLASQRGLCSRKADLPPPHTVASAAEGRRDALTKVTRVSVSAHVNGAYRSHKRPAMYCVKQSREIGNPQAPSRSLCSNFAHTMSGCLTARYATICASTCFLFKENVSANIRYNNLRIVLACVR